MEIKVVLGLLFGDCGKGNTVQWLCKKAISEGKRPLVVRYSGGPQAGHTVRHNGITHVCSSYGSGVLLGVPTLYIGGLIDPLCVANEKKALKDKGIKVPSLFTKELISLITPYDVADQQKWAEKNPHRTCGKGVMSTVIREDLSNSPIIVVSDTYVREYLIEAIETIEDYYRRKGESLDINPSVLDDWIEGALSLGDDTYKFHIEDYDVLIFEGTQGLLLDVDSGYYPYTTSTRVGLNGIPRKYLKGAEVYLVSRTYLTRHGAMGEREGRWFREDRQIDIPATKLETNVTNKYQGDFITAMWHNEPYREAVHRHCLDNYMRKYNMRFNLVVTHMDVEEAAGDSKSIRENQNVFFPVAIRQNLESAGLDIHNIYTSHSPDSQFELFYSNDN